MIQYRKGDEVYNGRFIIARLHSLHESEERLSAKEPFGNSVHR